MSKQDIIDILMRRDGDSRAGAEARVRELEDAINEIIDFDMSDEFMTVAGALEGIAQITEDLVGLEPDYTEYLYI